MVHEVVSRSLELKALPFRDPEGLGKFYVAVPIQWPADIWHACIAELTERLRPKALRVGIVALCQPRCRVAQQYRVDSYVRRAQEVYVVLIGSALSEPKILGRGAVDDHLAALHLRNTGDLPSVHRATDKGTSTLHAGQIEHVSRAQHLRPVKI